MKNIIKVVLSNRLARFVRPYPYELLRELYRFRIDGWQFSPQGRVYIGWCAEVKQCEKEGEPIPEERGWDGFIRLLRYDSISAGLFLALRKEIEEEHGIQFVIQDNRIPLELNAWTPPKEARDYQIACVEKMRKAKTGGLVLSATGSGKTRVAGMYAKSIKGSLLFVVDELTLMRQAQKELSATIGEKVGIIGESVFAPERVSVGTIQTVHLHRNDEKYRQWSKHLQVIILDELHLCLNRRNVETIRAIRPKVVFGLTATLQLKKQVVRVKSYELAGPVIFEFPLQEGVEKGVLSKGIAVAVEVENDVEKVIYNGSDWYGRRRFYMRRYPEEYRNIIVNGKKRNRVIVDLVEKAHAAGKYIVILVERRNHIFRLHELLEAIPHHLVFGDKKADERELSKLKFEVGQIRLLITTKVFKKGIDIKRVDMIIDAAAMKSRNDVIQKYGRGVRMCEEKEGLLYIDISDKDNRFEKAARGRRLALKSIGIPVCTVNSSLGAEKILSLAEKRLQKELVGILAKPTILRSKIVEYNKPNYSSNIKLLG